MSATCAVVHDFFRIRGGGERLALTLARHLPADLIFGFRSNSSFEPSAFDDIVLRDLQINMTLQGSQTLRLIQAFRQRTQYLKNYDCVIYSGDFAPFAAANHRNGPNIFYCHTPSRLAYDKQARLLADVEWRRRPLLILLAAYLKICYQRALPEMDIVVANSKNVQQRIRRYWGRDAEVVYPPCDIDRYRWIADGDYYLSTARLEPLKRVDLIIEAFRRMPNRRLVVTSGGSQLEKLQRLAEGADNICFTGWIGEGELQGLLGRAIATVYIPEDEDFGMSPVESMAAGKPVIGVAEGGLLESVIPGETGVLLPAPLSVEAIVEAVSSMSKQRVSSMRKACENRAREFRLEIFIDAMKRVIQRAL